jgi:hypothetical protein
VVLKYCTGASPKIFPASVEGWTVDTGENRPVTERESVTEIMMRLSEQPLELVRVFVKQTNFFFAT